MNNSTGHPPLKHWRTRFVDPGEQADYHRWSIDDRIPATVLAGWAAAAGWTFPALFFNHINPDFPQIVFPVVFLLMVPAILLALFVSRFESIRYAYALPISAAVLSLSGFVAAWFFYVVSDHPLGIGLGLMMAILFAPLMRLQAPWTCAALCPPLLYCAFVTVGRTEQFGLSDTAVFSLIGLPVVAAMTVCVSNLMADQRALQAYLNLRVIREQGQKLSESQQLMRRYLAPAVAEHILDGNEAGIREPVRRRVTVMFTDIAGFTDIADRVEPEVMSQVLSEFLGRMVELIESSGGTVNEFAGDGLMALWGAPDALAPEDQVKQALQAGLNMQAAMPELNQSWRKLGLGTELKVRIGFNTGMVSVGSYGSAGRMTYTAIGLQTNIASRIEAQAQPGQVLFSEASYQLIADEIPCTEQGEIQYKGVHFPIAVYAASDC